jgi:hypothetical protein
MTPSIFHGLVEIGLNPIPIIWDQETRSAESHQVKHSDVTAENYQHIASKWAMQIERANGIALKLFPPFGMFDIDQKNTTHANTWKRWMEIVQNECPDVLRKICIETTRNNGAHIYVKYPNAKHKVTIACNPDGNEVISYYTGGLLSYCYPTPGYNIVHGAMEEIEELTPDEFDKLVSVSAIFNEYEKPLTTPTAVINYPNEYEQACLLFDANITDEAFTELLNQITLYEVAGFRYAKKHKFTAFLRQGSEAIYSAKVYYRSKRCLLFTTSILGFPSWADRRSQDDHSWILTPAKIVYYKNQGDWTAAIAEMQAIANAIGIELEPPQITHTRIEDHRLQFPYDIFPDEVSAYIHEMKINPEMLANFFLGAFTTAIGNTAFLWVHSKWIEKPVIFLALAAPAGSVKSGAMNIAFDFIYRHDALRRREYKSAKAEYESTDTKGKKKPVLRQVIIDDVTMEVLAKILEHNPRGCTVLPDELIGFLNRLNRYAQGDDEQKILSIFNSKSFNVQRIGRDEDLVDDYSLSIIGGIQNDLLSKLSDGDRGSNGFFHRFLIAIPDMGPKQPFQLPNNTHALETRIDELFRWIMVHRDEPDKTMYVLSNDALKMYEQWHNAKNDYYNRTHDNNVKGIIAKYQGYCLRFALIIQCIRDADVRTGIISQASMERAIRLTDYYLANMNKAIRFLAPENPIDKLKEPYKSVYDALPVMFTIGVGTEVAKSYKLKPATFKSWLSTKKELFKSEKRGTWEKLL